MQKFQKLSPEVVSYRMNEIHRVNPNDWIKEDLKLLHERISNLE